MTTQDWISRDITRTTLAVVLMGILTSASFWILLPFLTSIVWATIIVVTTWPTERNSYRVLDVLLASCDSLKVSAIGEHRVAYPPLKRHAQEAHFSTEFERYFSSPRICHWKVTFEKSHLSSDGLVLSRRGMRDSIIMPAVFIAGSNIVLYK